MDQSPEDRPWPYFFLSFAASEESYENRLVERFFGDLCDEIALYAVRPPASTGTLAGGDEWSSELVRALATSRTMVCLCSPEYFGRPSCGRAWTVFERRLAMYRATFGWDAPSLIPLPWVPTPVLDVVRAHQPSDDLSGSLHQRIGVRALVRQRQRYSDEYREFVNFLARRIVAVAEEHDLPPDDETLNFADIPDAFARLGRAGAVAEQDPSQLLVRYATAKIVLVGESSVGKTGLGWRLAHREFKEQSSTHGQQFWPLDELSGIAEDGAQYEAILWDLAGQPDYRLIHALFVDNADLALIVFDPARDEDPLPTIDYWLRQLRVGDDEGPAVILVAGRADRGGLRLTDADVAAICASRGIAYAVTTSALTGEGVDTLVERMREAINWRARPRTVTTATFKQIKDLVIRLKETGRRDLVVLDPVDLRERLEVDGIASDVTDDELVTAVGHLANHGYVSWLDASDGHRAVLLAPEVLNNLAASLVLEARRNPHGLGSLEEQRLLAGELPLPELERLAPADRDLMLDSAIAMFLSRNICFRSTDPLSNRTYLVFPELINLNRPAIMEDADIEEAVSYTVSGAVENVYASLVVMLGYTSTFVRTDQWRNHARYVMGDNRVCSLRLESEQDGALSFVLSFGAGVEERVRTLFQCLFESLLEGRDLDVRRYPTLACVNRHRLDRALVRDLLNEGKVQAFCGRCGERVVLPARDILIAAPDPMANQAAAENRTAHDRSRFEEAIYRLKAYVNQTDRSAPSCFISYAWGIDDEERWVEHSLAEDLAKAGLAVILDKWENARFGASVPRFVERGHGVDRFVVVGTPEYARKYANDEPMGNGFVVAAEGDLIGRRMIGTEHQKNSVVPILLRGTPETAFPPLLQGRVYADFRSAEQYFATAFDLILNVYGLRPQDQPGIELRRLVGGVLS